jgi:hypothetical protein
VRPSPRIDIGDVTPGLKNLGGKAHTALSFEQIPTKNWRAAPGITLKGAKQI